MAAAIQYDLFEDYSETAALKLEITNVRKGLFSRNKKIEESVTVLLKMCLDHQDEIANLKQQLLRIRNE